MSGPRGGSLCVDQGYSPEKEKCEEIKKYFDIDFVVADVTKENDVTKAVNHVIKKKDLVVLNNF